MQEIDVRAAMLEKFNISNGWVYELTRAMVKRYPEIHLRKIEGLNAEVHSARKRKSLYG